MQELDKAGMGQRIRQIRLGAKLRQWELAKILGTTQSAIHKYEHGVIPEPRRLVEIARVGGTSLEWVLTGTHWENGSADQERVSPELLRTAAVLREVSAEGRNSVNEALRIVRDAIQALDDPGNGGHQALRDHSSSTLHLLQSAARIQRAVLKRVTDEADRRLDRSPLFTPRAQDDLADSDAADKS